MDCSQGLGFFREGDVEERSIMALSKSEKQLIKQRTMAKRIKSAKRFVGKNLWRAARIKALEAMGAGMMSDTDVFSSV